MAAPVVDPDVPSPQSKDAQYTVTFSHCKVWMQLQNEVLGQGGHSVVKCVLESPGSVPNTKTATIESASVHGGEWNWARTFKISTFFCHVLVFEQDTFQLCGAFFFLLSFLIVYKDQRSCINFF